MRARKSQTNCHRCGEVSARFRSGQWLCPRHYRFLSMRESAKRRQVVVPSDAQLQSILDTAGMDCPVCHRTMNWLREEGTQTVVTLQHDRDGNMRFLCMSCNCRHWAYDGDSFYEVGPDQKRCNHCGQVKPLADFCTNNANRWANKNNVCRACAAQAHQEYRAKPEYREKFNAYMRAYKAARRNYYPEPGRMQKAEAQHRERQEHLHAVYTSLEAEAIQIAHETR
jgi:hypothetical protein